MAKINGTLTFVDKNGEDKSIVRVIEDLPEIKFGNHLSNDILIKSEDVEDLHCKICFNEIYRIIIKNYSTSHPILVNNQVVERSKEIKSGDVITILENSMRWETKDDAKRRISCLSKEERRAIKRKYIKTNKRITIHSVSVQSMNLPSSDDAGSSSSSAEKVSIPENLPSTPEESEEVNSPVKEQQSAPKDKENEKTPIKVNKLNMSGTLLTSYTPPALKLTRSVSKTPFIVPLRSPLVKSASKSILNDSLNISKFDSPKSAQKLNTSQMHLIDLTTPFTKRTESTPKSSTIRKTPRTIGKTPLRNATLLKSAIKNSSIQKNVMQNVSSIATKGKQLFESPIKSSNNTPVKTTNNTPIKEDTPSLIEISMSSVSEVDTSKGSVNDISNCEVQKVEENNGKTTNDEVKDLLECIDSVLEGEKVTDIQRSSIGSINDSLFDKALNDVPIEDINNFDKLLTDEGTSSNDDAEKKGELVLKMIEEARESLSTPNKTTQVLSARYSNITNESLTDSVNISQKYDATTPKISLLETVMSGRKSDLTMGPVSRLSLTKDSTEIVENYQLNSNNSESLRSTRKRMRTAMSSIGILNASQSADTTINESLNASNLNDNDQVDLNQSQPEETNILSLDNQPDLNTSNKENEFSGSLNNVSMKFIEYSEFDENNQESKKIFELSNEGDDLVDSDIESDSDLDEDEEEECPNEDIQDEQMDDEIVENENNENTSIVESNNISTKKCRISQADLDILGEEGIDILEQSKDEDQLEEMLKEAETEIQEKTEDPAENNGTEALPETTTGNNGVNDFEEIPETQQIELDENIVEDECPLDESEYLDDIPETQQMDLAVEEALDTNDTFDGTVEALDSTKESEPSNDTQEISEIQQDELPAENEDVLDESVAVKPMNETNGNEELNDTDEKIEKLDDTVESQLENTKEDSFNDHVEIPATQAFDFDQSIVVEQLDETNEDIVNIKEEASLARFESSGSVVTVNDSIIISSQEPVNKSDTVESISIQEISDSSELCSQESNIARLGSSLNADDLISEIESNEVEKDSSCTAQESKDTITSLNSNVSETINELIATPTDILTKIAVVQQYSSTEIGSEHMEIPATQEIVYNEETAVEEEEKTVEGDSAIGTTASKIDQTNESEEKRIDNSIAENPAPSRESALFSDTEFSHVELNASAFLKETDSDDFPESKNNLELTDIETIKAQIDVIEEDKSEKQQELIKKELEKVDFEAKIVKNSRSILPSEIESSSGSRKTMIPEQIDDSFADFIDKKQKELKESEVIETEEVQDKIVTKNENLEITSSVNEEKMNEIEEELARMNAETIVDIEKKRAASLMPTFDGGESSNKETSRMTLIPSEDNRRSSFLVLLEEEKSEMLQQKESLESVEEKPVVEDDKAVLKTDELSSDIQEDEEKEKEPIVEEPCIKKQAYVTTESESQVMAPETPSRRRVARVNYSELATGSPARSRRGRSASTESNGDKEKEPKSAVKRKEKCVKMEPIVEDEFTVQITATATENVEEIKVPLNEDNSSELDTEMTEKEPEVMATEENVEEEISEPIEDKEMLPEEEIANGQDNDITPEIITDNTQEKLQESETSEQHPENLQLMEVPKPENLQLMEVPAPEKLQVMEVTKPEKLQVVEVQKPSKEHPKDDILEDISNNVDTPHKEDKISESVDEDVINNTENVETKLPSEKQIDEMPESTSEDPEDPEVIEQIDDKIIESTKKEDSEPVEEATDDVVKAIEETESTENVQEEIVQKEELEIEEKVQTVEEIVPSESVTQEQEIASKSEEVVVEPQTSSRKRAKKLNYLELASGSPARTPRRGRTASVEEKQEKSTKLDLPATISEEVSDKTKDEEVVSSSNDELVIKEVIEEPKEAEKLPEVKKKPGRARKIEQLKPETEDVPTPSKRLRRGVTPVHTPLVEPEKKSRKRQQKVVEPEPVQSHEKELEATEPEKQNEDIITISSTENIEKPVVKKGRGRQAKVVEDVPKHDEKVDEPQPAKKGRGRKAKVDELPVLEEKSPEKVESSPKRGRGRKAAVEESHEEKAEVVETPMAKKSRKRQHEKPVETEKPKDTEDINTDETVESPQPAKKQNQVQKTTAEVVEHVQLEKASVAPKRGRKAKVETVPEVQEPEKEEIVPKRAGRKGKIEEIPETHEEPEPAVQEAPKKGRGRKKVEETPKEEEIVHEKVEEPAPKRAGRKGKNEVAEQTVPETPKEESAPKRTGRKGKLETIAAEMQNNPAQETPKRGRKPKVDATPVIQEEPQSQHVEEIAPKKGGRKAKVEAVVVETHEEPVVAQEAPKKGRGRKKVDEAPKVEEPQTSNVEEEVIPVKKGRGRQAKVVEKVVETKTDETEEVETEAPKRGRQLKHKVVEPETNDQPVIKKPRGRQAKQEVNTKELESQPIIESPKSVKTPIKKKVGSKHVTIITPSTQQAAAAHHSKESTTKSDEPVVAKRATKRQAAHPVIEEEPVPAKRSTRVRK